jgi:hypothetical protein
MINTAADMLTALRRGVFAGIILYQGASMLDGSPIVAIATKITRKSKNAKTGYMVQTFIIRSDIDPVKALRAGLDASVCGFCIHRPYLGGACYVQVARSVLSVYMAYKRGRYAQPGIDYDPRILPELFADRVFRLGSYGDPTAVPFQIWRAATLRVKAKAGYSHQWRDPRFAAFKLLCMASADTARDHEDAIAVGWRPFRVRSEAEPMLPGEVRCPASKEAGYRTNCASCRACGGTEAKAKASITIIAHGPTASRFAAAQAAIAA